MSAPLPRLLPAGMPPCVPLPRCVVALSPGWVQTGKEEAERRLGPRDRVTEALRNSAKVPGGDRRGVREGKGQSAGAHTAARIHSPWSCRLQFVLL